MNGNDYQNGGDKSSSTTKTEQRKEGSRIITTTTTITKTSSSTENGHGHQNINGNGNGYTNGNSYSNGNAHHYRHQNGNGHHHFHHHAEETEEDRREVTAGKTTFIAHKWKPKAALMICSHRKRDKRCGVTAQILKKEFTRILRSRDIYGDCEDDVEIWLISHIGGHKFAGNVIVHRREGGGMAVWYGRVEPCHAEAIVERTIINGEVIKELHRGSMIGSFNSSCKKMAW
ncbi:Sucrase/ferredoxin-like-domain-containing protein [Lobosporangium transversale]|uniref:Sucrase/ferredoxin-like-domain-containing protein n=1 Tax=Lobosporangium transversale TaxID=64571 RepID=A0A1Y2GT46_9FUNG|nr:Sucrase/ferredoxin-like-domain-containing protein [Lobosporangium transversale]ORZ21962.1 Sucrase/ferredoxin-like-domain-containing protein [Lobosporangium transversale]|eukprot:XP_021883213.1 Sucrase/ferredoxin-like-domain-containing protein [Lobosporangium transversale]